MRLRMLAVCAGAEGGLDTVIEALLGELAEGKDDALRLIERSGLTEFFWKQVGQAYGYQPDEPDFEDFAIALFQSAYCASAGRGRRAERRGAAGLPPLEEQPPLGGGLRDAVGALSGPAEDPRRSVASAISAR